MTKPTREQDQRVVISSLYHTWGIFFHGNELITRYFSVCPDIHQCEHRSCTTASNVFCKRCYEDNSIFKRYNSDKECQRMYWSDVSVVMVPLNMTCLHCLQHSLFVPLQFIFPIYYIKIPHVSWIIIWLEVLLNLHQILEYIVHLRYIFSLLFFMFLCIWL